ncbi:hypothetical protein L798_04441 [Zootermopsis nevadensis]|uniref:Uncharacterized protein n=1 Tax=Zootermopsis nevadensis TaxID=136037 RepID=A0A067QFG3_ZOONE|nr:hypothetical protein L798_04441 [Zootermopsis nevadensis]
MPNQNFYGTMFHSCSQMRGFKRHFEGSVLRERHGFPTDITDICTFKVASYLSLLVLLCVAGTLLNVVSKNDNFGEIIYCYHSSYYRSTSLTKNNLGSRSHPHGKRPSGPRKSGKYFGQLSDCQFLRNESSQPKDLNILQTPS